MTKFHESGMGDVCQLKADKESTESKTTVRVEILHKSRTRRSYLVFTLPRKKVVIYQNGEDRSADCECMPEGMCEHISIVSKIDRERFI